MWSKLNTTLLSTLNVIDFDNRLKIDYLMSISTTKRYFEAFYFQNRTVVYSHERDQKSDLIPQL